MTFGKMQVDGGFFQIVMPQQQLNRAQVGTGFEQVGCETMAQRVRMNLLRGQTGPLCGVTTGVPDCFGVMGRWAVWLHPPGNNHCEGFRFNPRQYSRKASKSLGLSMTSRSSRPLPPWMWMTIR